MTDAIQSVSLKSILHVINFSLVFVILLYTIFDYNMKGVKKEAEKDVCPDDNCDIKDNVDIEENIIKKDIVNFDVGKNNKLIKKEKNNSNENVITNSTHNPELPQSTIDIIEPKIDGKGEQIETNDQIKDEKIIE